MNSKNEKHFYRILNVQVCELLQVLTEAAILKGALKNKCSWNSRTQYSGGSSPSDRVRRVSCSVQIFGEKNYNLKASICRFFEIFCEIFL